MNYKRCDRKGKWHNLKNYPRICLDGLRKDAETRSQNIGCPGQHSNQETSEYKLEAWSLEPTCSDFFFLIIEPIGVPWRLSSLMQIQTWRTRHSSSFPLTWGAPVGLAKGKIKNITAEQRCAMRNRIWAGRRVWTTYSVWNIWYKRSNE
jgi:hypothetical protein